MGIADIFLKKLKEAEAASQPVDRRFDGWTPAQEQADVRVGLGDNTSPADDLAVGGADLFVWGTNDGGRVYSGYSPELQSSLATRMTDMGLIDAGDFIPGQPNKAVFDAFDVVLDWSEYYGITPLRAMAKIEQEGAYRDTVSGSGSGSGGGGGGASTAQTIPDYETISQRAKNMLKQELGREVEDWEMKLAADEMQRQYRSANASMLKASLAGSGEFEVADPVATTQAFIQEEYAPEIERVQDVAQEAANHKLSMDVLTQGAGMIG